MKKIIAVFDGLRISESALQYATRLAKQQAAHLVGLFLDDFTYNSFSMYQLLKEGATPNEIYDFEARDKSKRDAAARLFETACREAGLNYTIHHDRNIAIQEVLHESIYADLLIVNVRETMTRDTAPPPTRFIRDLLTDVQCPVLLVPTVYQEISKAVLLYDGEPSSVHAIKMYSYTLAPLDELQTEVLSVNDPGAGLHLDDNRLMKEFMKRHFPAVTYKVMEGQPEDKILTYLQYQPPGTLVVLGAYRRGTVSRWFRASMADVLMKTLTLPLFIAHNK
ncbi:adenine nucleotide alpha hydrolase family protein [Chitinophaga japonensis]|uniref:Nucleotide-binding universal stress UspA family protein n=1 Tax=Chitinophaga japonensis TaxID=104662 RepID=A0A562SSA8_CHIJA|nr:universal stress protein [Chitinophaga japonensis]TWI84147.1 hypothetical protein LX66_4509 [Chitinophaga japonensis]